MVAGIRGVLCLTGDACLYGVRSKSREYSGDGRGYGTALPQKITLPT